MRTDSENQTLDERPVPLRVLSVREVARILQINEPAVRRLIRDGELVASRVGRLWRIRMEALERFLDASESARI